MNQNNLRFTPAAFSLALIGLGVQHFWFGEYIAGRAPAWPESIQGKVVFAYVTGLLFIITEPR